MTNCELINVEQNHIADQGILSLAAAIDQKALPKLKTLHVYKNQAKKASKEVMKKTMAAGGIKGSVQDAWDMLDN